MTEPDRRYVRLDGPHAEPDAGIDQLYLEVDRTGDVLREVGLDSAGRVAHRTPSLAYPHGTYGFWDLVRVPDSLGTDIPLSEFSGVWNLPDSPVRNHKERGVLAAVRKILSR